MPLYHYRALNLLGQPCKGDWFGNSKQHLYQHLYQHLRQQNLHLLSCRIIKGTGLRNVYLKGIGPQDLIEFCIHCQEMDKAKISLSDSILLFAENYNHHGLKSVLVAIHHSLQQGLHLSQACQLFPWVFNAHFVDCLMIAEKTGNFSAAFGQLETYLVRQTTYHQQLKQALRYPLVLLGGLVLLLGVMGGVFLPHLQTHLQHGGGASVVSLIATIDFFKDYGAYIIFGFVTAFVAFCLAHNFSGTFRLKWGNIFLRFPMLGTFKRNLFINQFAQTLGLLINADINLLESLQKSANSVSNDFLKAKFFKVFTDVESGLKLSASLQNRRLASSLIYRYVQLGEETGNLGPLIQQAAEADLKNIWRRLNALLAWIQPVLIMFIGGVLIWIVMATIVPLYDNLSSLEG
ncbi:type II secretion system F family protein [Candidatus Finniella inopinata]|uniref:Type II secretion system F family protein n=1 Tax=Candidatus Finniella inopinata TaxID=1696036 RepID=A0A4Q7DHS3_9PROT|nr:type II secretion system F family protein [Candidatus Finniella inopinata]RZI46491.1 type II secretion system F family protein [Candidatus Finniella inopinata]